jgi:hypothetical protein
MLLLSALVLFVLALPVAAENTEDLGDPGPHGSVVVPAPVLDWTERDILCDNGPLFNGTYGGSPISILQQGSLGLSTYGFNHSTGSSYRVADDFVIPVGQTWSIAAIVFYAYQTGSTTVSTFTDYRVQIWDGPPSSPGSTVLWGDLVTNRLTSSVWSGGYRVLDVAQDGTTRPIMANTCTLTVPLSPGTYWLDWTCAGTLTSGPWCPPITITGVAATGNGMQYTTTWAPALDTGTTRAPQGLSFVIEGTIPTAIEKTSWSSIKSLYR